MSTKLAVAFLGLTIAAKFVLNYAGFDFDPVQVVAHLWGPQ